MQTTNESLVRSLSQPSNVPNSRAETPESPAEPDEPAKAFSTSSTMTTHGDIASTSRRAWRMFASDWPTSEPSSVPTSRISVGRPVSHPSALQNALLPEPGGPSRSTPRARTPSGRPGRRAREQNDLSCADVSSCSLQEEMPPLQTRVAGLFVFWPLLVQLGFGELVNEPVTWFRHGPATSALLSLLALKLIDKERRSHISDFDFDQALGLFAGLNVLPKATFATDYSYRTVRENQQRLLAGWISKLLPRLDPQPDAFSLDFHPIPHRGQDNGLENHHVPMRGKAVPVSSRSSPKP